jgi:nucleoside-diphosphate-sugar epimerase
VTKETGILVTGATGFIGGRVCERLVQAGFKNVRGLVHDFSHAPRVARLPIELRQGDLMNPKSVKDALADCKIVFHLGLGQGPGIAGGTRNLLKAAGDAQVEQLVHISTTSVYGLKPAANAATEETRPRPTGNEYSDYKLAAERAVQYFMTRGLPAVILRPSIVIGPYSHWSIGVINQLRQGSYQLMDQGNGLCNTTYVDNLVDAMLLAAQKPEAVGQIFTITDGERITWGDFVRAHARMLGTEPVFESVSSAEVESHFKKQPGLIKASMKASRKVLTGPQLRILLKEIPLADRMITWAWYRTQTMSEVEKDKLRRRLSGGGPALKSGMTSAMPDAGKAAIQSSDVFFSIEKARRLLGYSPRIQFAEAMQRTEQWLRFANFLSA